MPTVVTDRTTTALADGKSMIFSLSLLGLLVITLLTMGFETWRAARANPVVSLRSE